MASNFGAHKEAVTSPRGKPKIRDRVLLTLLLPLVLQGLGLAFSIFVAPERYLHAYLLFSLVAPAMLIPLLLDWVSRPLGNVGAVTELDELRPWAHEIANLQAASEALSSLRQELFRHLSHQIKSPLAMVRVAAEKEGTDFSAFTILTIDSVSRLVEQMMLLAWTDSLQATDALFQVCNLPKLLIETRRSRLPLAEERGIHIQLKFGRVAGTSPSVRGIPSLLSDLMHNLLDNALKHSPRDSTIALSIQQDPADKDSWEVSVSDEGPGVPIQERERIFIPFYGDLGEDSNGERQYGTRQGRASKRGADSLSQSHGLGLSIVRSIALLHRGEVKFHDPHNGVGALVLVTLKKVASTKTVPKNSAVQATQPRTAKGI